MCIPHAVWLRVWLVFVTLEPTQTLSKRRLVLLTASQQGFQALAKLGVSLTNAVQEPGASHATQLRCSLEEGILAVRIVHRLG